MKKSDLNFNTVSAIYVHFKNSNSVHGTFSNTRLKWSVVRLNSDNNRLETVDEKSKSKW